MSVWWLSFVDPVADQFLGACVVEAIEFLTAVRVAHFLDINPGGAVRGVEIPDAVIIPPEYMERLLSREEIVELDVVLGAPPGPEVE